MADKRLPRRYRLTAGRAWAAAAWENAWPRLWPPVAIVLLFVALALIGLPMALAWWAHWLYLAGFALALGWGLWRGLRHLTLPDRRSAWRRVERVSGLAHRPLTEALDEQALGLGNPTSTQLWRVRGEGLPVPFRRLRAGWPRPGLGDRDRYALRGALGLLLVIGLFAAGGDWRYRLASAFEPASPAAAGDRVPFSTDIIVTPPAYTRLLASHHPPMAPEDGAILVPEGSEVLLRITGAGEAVAAIDGEPLALERLDNANLEATVTADHDARLTLTSPMGEAAWRYAIVPDNRPEVAFVGELGTLPGGVVEFGWRATDDYGVVSAYLDITLTRDAPAVPGRERWERRLSEPPLPLPEMGGTRFEDLAAHPWSGLPARLEIRASDALGEAVSEPIELVLPVREFAHPVAAAIADMRRRLLQDAAALPMVTEVLSDLAAVPRRYNDDVTVFLALRTAARRLDALESWQEAPVLEVAGLLWQTALRLDGGDLALAQLRLRQAEQALREALENGASDAEIAERMAELREAMDAYLEAMQRDLMERLQSGELTLDQMPFGDPSQMIDREGLDELLDRLENLSRSGAREEAEQLLADLQRMMESMTAGLTPQQGQQGQAMQMLQDLQNLAEMQQRLMDQTFDQAQRGQPGDNQSFGEEARQVQEQLRRQLGQSMADLADMMGGLPQGLGQAELSMRQAEQALGQGQPGDAIGPQAEALDQLQQGLQQFADQLMEQMAEQGGGMGQPFPQRRPGEDPFGRTPGGEGGFDTSPVDIPDIGPTERARDILDELRRRAGERERPRDELDYIDRLLRQF
ncbi:MAG: DUF4175 family protein [Azospirillaceae bacterium]